MGWVDYFLSDAGQKLVQNLIAVVAIVLAVRGVRTWSLERRDIRRAELAEKSLEAAYRIRDIISAVRSPLGYEGEGSSRQRDANESDEVRRQKDQAFVPIERINSNTDDYKEMQALRYSISTAFGKDAASLFDEFFKVRNEIIVTARINARVGGRSRMSDVEIEQYREREAIIWEGIDEPDKIVARLDEAVENLEQRFRPYVEARFRAPRLFWWRTPRK